MKQIDKGIPSLTVDSRLAHLWDAFQSIQTLDTEYIHLKAQATTNHPSIGNRKTRSRTRSKPVGPDM
ncbi:hypothetical protein HPB48_011930 [Haemaphysalis longicornis]|uniref:Uncharacterized protein n=1 Tax=Haemaphysalis longicornis TaxID=44386 RepID=A0A9J6FQI9_HAELO|nr:hypothetical protein HPB48_011930 [Haemaphysalis longicornis]